jgi:hypothetical protein
MTKERSAKEFAIMTHTYYGIAIMAADTSYQPKYGIGQSVYIAETSRTSTPIPCPDCLALGTWTVTTPAGGSVEVDCLRCKGRNAYWSELPALELPAYQPSTRLLTVGSVRIDTGADIDRQIEYMCVETGIGSGTLWAESDLYATESEALDAATMRARVDTDRVQSLRAAKSAVELGRHRIADALRMKQLRSLFSAWYHGNCMLETFEAMIHGTEIDGHVIDIPDEAKQELRWALDYHKANASTQEMAVLYDILIAHISELPDPVRDALENVRAFTTPRE